MLLSARLYDVRAAQPAKLSPRHPAAVAGSAAPHRRYPMLAVNLTGTKEIVVYVVVIVVILIAAVWYSRGRSRS
jgi:hypothetical protein